MASSVESIEGIGPVYAGKLREAGIETVEALLEAARRSAGRRQLAEKLDLPAQLILRWANQADLCRISGVGSQFSELLEAAGVDTVRELRNRNAANLATKLARINSTRKLSQRVPSGEVVQDWIDQANRLAPALEY